MTKQDPNRANQILSHAQILFFQGGYEDTSIADIVKSAGVTKGAFYHHFSSKADILEQLLDRLVAHLGARLNDIDLQQVSSPVDSYLTFLHVMRSEFEFPSQQANPELGRAIYLDENDSIRNKLCQKIVDLAVPVLSGILEKGLTNTKLSPDEAKAASELVMQISLAHQPALKRLRYASTPAETLDRVQEVEHLIKQQGIAIDRLIGLPDGTTELRSQKAMSKLPNLGKT
ncbi:TetR/AcrR family transcriptional regulator [Cohaesibacter gelatinilyticus]|uniref:Transcriptional regulator, TetR family n=1 Tax=Cohaesibacter gelatinilyticus TaxID=372072 RepID=A0A285PI08_9HYPH|nr:TetR/AcrR family transcriptional regulator [Cohaesibacter gelatinilyticus]SNZ21355.1 transcriptional regulator, TetR family [Cohaesibacter gelatinilyticus]